MRGSTVTFIVAFLPLPSVAVAVIVQFPSEIPVIKPSCVTVAIDGSEEDQT